MRKAAWIAGCLALMLVSFNAWAVGNKDVDCNRDHNHFDDDLETYMTQEQFTVPMGSGVMQVAAAHNGGVKLIGGDSNNYEVTVCKYAGANSQSEGDQILKQITSEHTANSISVRGPEADRWTAFLIIRVPAGANMSVSSYNGPLSARSVSGTFDFKAQNGPISVKQISGKVSARAQNGPISFEGDTGSYDLETQNGPISIDLASLSWQDGKLDAHATNGPISLRLPMGYQSGVVVTSDGHAPMSCSAEVCKQARKTWEGDEKRIEFGPENAVIHISTHNGPVSVGTREASM